MFAQPVRMDTPMVVVPFELMVVVDTVEEDVGVNMPLFPVRYNAATATSMAITRATIAVSLTRDPALPFAFPGLAAEAAAGGDGFAGCCVG